MSFLVNGVQVAGSGKSAYLYALAGGYSGTEKEFYSALANTGTNNDSKIFPLKFTYDTTSLTWSCDKTYSEVNTALKANKFIYAIATGKKYGYTIYIPDSGSGSDIGSIAFINIGYGTTSVGITPSGNTKSYACIAFSRMVLNSSDALIESDQETICVPYNYSIVLEASKWNITEKTLEYKGIYQIGDEEREQMITVAPSISSRESYQNAQVQVINQKSGTLIFGCNTIPTEDLTVYVNVQGVTQL